MQPLESLDNNIRRRGYLSVVEACEVIADVLVSLGELHAAGVAHGSIDAEHILIDEKLRATLVPATAQRAGSPRADLYDVALALSFSVTGERSRSMSLPTSLSNIMHRAMTLDPVESYRGVYEMLVDVRAASTNAETIPIQVIDTSSILTSELLASVEKAERAALPTTTLPRSRRRRMRLVGAFAASWAIAAIAMGVAFVAGESHAAAETIAPPMTPAESLELSVASPTRETPPPQPTETVTAPVTRPRVPAPTPTHTNPIVATAHRDEVNGATEMAIAGYRRYLRTHPDGRDAGWVRTRLTVLESGRTMR